MAARWNNDPRQGSAFHELVVLPTLAPQLARTYHIPGTPEYHAAEAGRHQQAVANPGLFHTSLSSGFSDRHHGRCSS